MCEVMGGDTMFSIWSVSRDWSVDEQLLRLVSLASQLPTQSAQSAGQWSLCWSVSVSCMHLASLGY